MPFFERLCPAMTKRESVSVQGRSKKMKIIDAQVHIWQDATCAPTAVMASVFLPRFRAIAERYPRLKLVIDHCGLNRHGQDEQAFIYLDELVKTAKLPNVALKATGAPHYSTQGYPFKNIHDGLH